MSFAIIANATKEGATELYHEAAARAWEIAKALFKHPEMLWIIIPVVVSMIFISYYFGKYKKEELGWNTAFGNSVVLLFACMDLFRYLYGNQLLGWNNYTILVSVVLMEGIILTTLDFLHALPKSFAFALSSGMTVNTIVLFLILLVYGQIPLDHITALAVTAMALAIVALLRIMQFFELSSDKDGKE